MSAESPTPQDEPVALQRILGRLQRQAVFRREHGVPLTDEDIKQTYSTGSSIARSEVPPSKEQKRALVGLVDEVSDLVQVKGKDFTHAGDYERDLRDGILTPEEEKERFFVELGERGTSTFISTDTYEPESDPDSIILFHLTSAQHADITVSVDFNYLFQLDIEFTDPRTEDLLFVYSTGTYRKTLADLSVEDFAIINYYLTRSKEALEKMDKET